jgi:hypothetical protein
MCNSVVPIGTSLGLRTSPRTCKYFKGFPKYLAFSIGGGFHAQILDNSLGRHSTKSDVQITYAHSPKVISRTKGVNAHQCKA